MIFGPLLEELAARLIDGLSAVVSLRLPSRPADAICHSLNDACCNKEDVRCPPKYFLPWSCKADYCNVRLVRCVLKADSCRETEVTIQEGVPREQQVGRYTRKLPP